MVLVVEDEEIIRAVASEVLLDAGFSVIEAGHADHALRLLNEGAHEIHALFTDVNMPGSMDGYGLAHLSRRTWPWIVLLIASGRPLPQLAQIPPGSRFLPKPYHPLHVVNHLREMLAA